jgi:uncharacterized protein DUF397
MNRARMRWRKSSYSSDSGNCVEVALTSQRVGVRDSKNPGGPELYYAERSWRDFLVAIRAGEFDLPSGAL